jgi:type II secretory ATPase GspE/PulE/Tfp pilus assembly ATPase PilB-like protein
VFATLHTNDAPSAFTRLTDMGVEPFLSASSVIAVMGQRLVRKLCKHCKQRYTPLLSELVKIGYADPERVQHEGDRSTRPSAAPSASPAAIAAVWASTR